MDAARLLSPVSTGNKEVPRARPVERNASQKTQAQEKPSPKIDKAQVKAVLDNIIRDTRFQYVLKDEMNYFVVRIIDRETDKVIKEIPSQALQKVHEGLVQALGILFDEIV